MNLEGSGSDGTTSIWADLTWPANAEWLQLHSQDTTSRTAAWKWRHGFGNDSRHGDLDYYGECDSVRDPDCDHWYAEHDNCRAKFNPSQIDTDDDGRGDACDNCVGVKNPSQANCNLAAEEARLAGGFDPAIAPPILGDACDPVPCAAGSAEETEWVDTQCVRVGDHDECRSRRRRSTFRTPTVGSSLISPPGADQVSTVVPALPTEFRFCKSVSLPNYTVDCSSYQVMVDRQIELGESNKDPGAPWHRVRFGSSAVGQPRTWNYGADLTVLRWRHEDDAAAWFSNTTDGLPGIRLPSACNSDPAQCLDGVFWMHTATSVGYRERGIPYLANRFTPVAPEAGNVAYCPLLPEGIVQQPSAVGVAAPPQELVLGSNVRIGLGLGRAGSEPRPSVLAVPLAASASVRFGPLGALRDDGYIVPFAIKGADIPVPGCADSSASEAFSRMVTSVRWASNVDPTSGADGATTQLAAVGLDETGELRGATVRNEQIDEVARGTGPLARVAGELGPVNVKEPTLVYSGSAGGLYAVGGTDPKDGQPSPYVWFHPLPGPWKRVTKFETRDAVLAATYSFADGYLWMVVAPSDTDKGLRLVRVSPIDGHQDSVYQFSYRSGARPILTVDRDGSILLSMARLGDTKQARFWADGGGLHAQRILSLAGTLHRPVVVDDVDYARILEAPGPLRVDRVSSLATVGSVVACPCDTTFGEAL